MIHESIVGQLQSVDDFIRWYPKFHDIFGYLHTIEGYTLKLYAENAPGGGEVVEIGSFVGKSTCWLAAGLLHRNKGEKVWAVDHFQGSPEHQTKQKYECREILETGSTFKQFSDYCKPPRNINSPCGFRR